WVSKRGHTGWSPATTSGYYTRDTSPSDYLPYTPELVDRHLRAGDYHMGIYPMVPGDECMLLACDFDSGDWAEDAAAYGKECRAAGIDVLTEISRSGEGAHVWMFFDAAVPARLARRAGMGLLRRAMARRPAMSFESYDRFFPA